MDPTNSTVSENTTTSHDPPTTTSDKTDKADLKIILLGDTAVGKTKMIERYLQNEYCSRQLSTNALTLFRHDVTLGDGTRVKVGELKRECSINVSKNIHSFSIFYTS